MKPNSLAFRLVAGAAVWTALGLLGGGLALASIFRDAIQRNFDNRLIVVWESLVTLAEVPSEGDIVVPPLSDPRFGQTYSGWYWQISVGGGDGGDTGIVARSRSLFDRTLSVDPRVNPQTYTTWQEVGPEGQTLRVMAREVVLPGAGQPFYVVVAGDEAEVRSDVRRFNAILTWAFLALGLGLAIAMLIQVRFVVRPLKRVGKALAAIRNGKAERLDGDFPSEIAPLAHELNALIEHNAEVIERSRTHVGNLAHALKTPLSVLANEAQGEEGMLATVVARQTRLMRDQIEHHLARARAAGSARVIGARTEVQSVLSDLVRTLGKIYRQKGLSIGCTCEAGLAFRGERQDLEEMVGNLLDNACKWARRKVTVAAQRLVGEHDAPLELEIVIADDGLGLSDAERVAVLERGARLDETQPGSGLGLSIVKDLVRLYQGELMLSPAPAGGLAVRLRLPAAPGET